MGKKIVDAIDHIKLSTSLDVLFFFLLIEPP
jgi:hypothetical protein